MSLGQVKISNPKSNAPFLWKYVDLHRFIYLLAEKKLFFTRLDKFDDPYEGIKTEYLRRDAKFAKIEKGGHPREMGAKNKSQLRNFKKLHEYVKAQETRDSQKCQFVNCWFACDRESMAMWNIYSNRDSVAIRIDFELAKNVLTASFNKFHSGNHRMSIIGDEITYLRLNPFDEKLPLQNLEYSALKKDYAYQYEKEYRFLIILAENEDDISFLETPVELNELKITVISHPNMEDWKFKNLEKLIALYGLKAALEKSPTLLRSSNGS